MATNQNKLSAYSMEELAPLILDFIGRGKQVIITGKGNSMLPLIRSGKDHIKLSSCSTEILLPGDVVMYRRTNGSYVIHRIVSVEPDGTFTMKGDSQTWTERGITRQQIVAEAVSVFRPEKEITKNNKLYKVYAKFWTKSHIIRAAYELFLKLKTKIRKVK